MKTLGIGEVRQRYEVLKDTLEREGEVIHTHHGKPFARVLPLTSQTQQQLTRPPRVMCCDAISPISMAARSRCCR